LLGLIPADTQRRMNNHDNATTIIIDNVEALCAQFAECLLIFNAIKATWEEEKLEKTGLIIHNEKNMKMFLALLKLSWGKSSSFGRGKVRF
jgi:hypothetical protein